MSSPGAKAPGELMFKKPAWDDMSVVVSCSKPPLRDEFTVVI